MNVPLTMLFDASQTENVNRMATNLTDQVRLPSFSRLMTSR
jgi:hypothetical protein